MSTPPTSLQALLAQADWVQRLAGAMAADEATSRDLVQDTWAAALGGAHDVRDPRGWLRRVLENLVRERARAARRRTAREQRAARAEAVEGPSTVLERAELHRELVDRVLELGEPGRTLVLERFFDGLSPRALAHRHGVPLETVRTRLKRALARLRADMERDEQRGCGSWRALALPIPAALGPGTVAAAGVFVMTTATKWAMAGVAALALGLSTYGLWRSAPAQGGSDGAEPAAATPQAAEIDAAAEPEPAREPVPAASELHARLVGLRPALPWSTALAVTIRGGSGNQVVQRPRPDASGSVSVTLPEWASSGPVDVEIAADDPAYVPEVWRRSGVTDATETLQLAVVCAAAIEGTVRGAHDGDVVWLRAYPIDRGRIVGESVASTRAERDGGFALRVRAGDYLLVAAACDERQAPVAHVLPASTRERAVVGEVRRVPPLELVPAASVTGRVRLADGTPLQASVGARPDGETTDLVWAKTLVRAWADGTVAPYEGTRRIGTSSSIAGSFAIDGLARKPYALSLHEASGMVCVEVGRTIQTAEPPTDVDLVVDGAVLDVALRLAADGSAGGGGAGGTESRAGEAALDDTDLDGAALDGADLDGAALDGAALEIRAGGRTSIVPMSSGRIRLLVAVGTEYRLSARASGMVAATAWRAERAGLHHLVLHLTPPTNPVLVVRNLGDPADRELLALRLEPEEATREPTSLGGEQFEAGALRATDLQPGRYRLVMGHARQGDRRSFLFMEPVDVTIPDTGEVQVDVVVRRGGSIRLVANPSDRTLSGTWRLLDAGGREVPTGLEAIFPTTRRTTAPGELPEASSAETVRSLVPGLYRAELALDGQAKRTLRVEVVAGRCVDLLVPVD